MFKAVINAETLRDAIEAVENLDCILRGLEAQGRIVRTTGKLGMENISLRK